MHLIMDQRPVPLSGNNGSQRREKGSRRDPLNQLYLSYASYPHGLSAGSRWKDFGLVWIQFCQSLFHTLFPVNDSSYIAGTASEFNTCRHVQHVYVLRPYTREYGPQDRPEHRRERDGLFPVFSFSVITGCVGQIGLDSIAKEQQMHQELVIM